MKNKSLFLFLFIMFSIASFAQEDEKQKIETKNCKCIITELERKCGICGEFMEHKILQDEKGNYTGDKYICKNKECNHTHIVNKKSVKMHICREACFEKKYDIDTIKKLKTLIIKNICSESKTVNYIVEFNNTKIVKRGVKYNESIKIGNIPIDIRPNVSINKYLTPLGK